MKGKHQLAMDQILAPYKIETPQPAVGHPSVPEGNTGSVASDSSSGNTPFAEGDAVAQPGPRNAGRGDEIDFDCCLHIDGALTISASSGIFDLTPQEVLALGDYLHLTQTLWRP